ncbi:MAG: nuclear transport factor 2 family protein [Thermoplasmata archaeon]|nr:nuclear transport factor 2 family protein [Thermoplasmata archaeon]
MSEPDVVRTALRFVNEINRHDVPAMLSLMSDDHEFVDSLGHSLRGKERLREGWTTYFGLFPDYRILIEDHLQIGIIVGMFGSASGTAAVGVELPPSRRWKIPAAWKAVVRDERVEKWQVYADNEPAWKAMDVKRV